MGVQNGKDDGPCVRCGERTITMKVKLIKWLSLGLCVCMLSAFLPLLAYAVERAGDNYEEVEVWKRTDVILKSTVEYENPYKEVEIDAVFTHEDGTKIPLYGFWNGGDEWRVRFAPTKEGLWSYEINCSDTANRGLHQQKGKLRAVKNTGTTALDQHGFVRISDNGRYFVYDDGTPFYWLGDTNWQAPNYVSVTQCNYPGCLCESQFLHEVNDRVAKGFTVYQTYFDSAESDGGGQRETTSEPSMWKKRHELVDPKTFTEKFDVMFDHLADRGMVIALGFGVHSNTTQNISRADLDRISRYLTARYASYPVVWITAQEITGSPQFNVWNSSAKVVDKGDGYNHPQGAHQFPSDVNNSYVSSLDKQNWHEFYALQAGHGPTYPSKSLYEGYWNNTRSGKVKPYIETEANYEDVFCGGFNGYEGSRIAAWKANLLGSYGFTYGVTGVWANNYSTAGNTGWLGSFSYEPWYMGIDKPGSFEMTYLARFFQYVDFSTLVPRFNSTKYSDLTAETKVVSSSEDGKTYVAYFYNSDRSTGVLKGLNAGETYSAKWYNPLTGKFVEISDRITVTGGEYIIPEKPTTGDWALLVTSRTDLGDFTTEQAYTDPYIDTRTNFALGGSATVSSFTRAEYGAASAIDGNLSTWWCAKDGSMPQWLVLDLKAERTFGEIDLICHPGNETRTEYASFTVEGSSDGKTWTKLYTADKEKPSPYQGKDLFRITGEGSYRYLKVTFTEIKTNWAALYEIAVYDKPSQTDATDTGNGNILAGAVATSKSASPQSGAEKAIDGNASTWWCASDGSLPQWIAFDLGEAKAFNRFSFLLYGGTTSVSYLIEGSADGKNWTPVYEGVQEKTAPVGNSVQIAGQLEKVCNLRHLRITFTQVVGNWATVVEAEAHLAAKDDVLPTYGGTVQTPGVTSVGSHIYTASGVGSNTADALVDGDPATVWSPYAPIGSQTILMDLREQKALYGIEITLGKNAEVPKYRIEASKDGADWVILADATLRNAQTYNTNGRVVVSEALAGEYRYVKLLWLGGSSNSAVKTVGEIALYAEGDTPAAPEAADMTSLVTLYNEVRVLNNSQKVYTAPSFRTLSLTVAEVGKLLADPKAASDADVAKAEEALRTAYNGLVKADPNLQGPEGSPDDQIGENGGNAENGGNTEDTPDTPDVQPSEDSSPVIWITVAVIAAVAVGAVVILIFIIKKRKIKE